MQAVVLHRNRGIRSMLEELAQEPAQRSASMAQQNNGCSWGCSTLLALMVVGVLLAYWPVFLAIGLLVLAVYGLTMPGLQQQQRQLKAVAEAADQQVRQAPCRVRERFGVIQSISLAGDLFTPRLEIVCCTIADSGNQLEAGEICVGLTPPAEPLLLRSATGLATWLEGGGIALLEDLSVEARATRAAMECLRERAWTTEALGKLDELRTSVMETLAKAKGNELLEAAIPQLQQALGAFDAERQKLQQAHHSAGEMLRKLHDFLSVPDGIRPILNCDLDLLFDSQRLSALEQSFSEVVLLNDAFRQLSRDALA